MAKAKKKTKKLNLGTFRAGVGVRRVAVHRGCVVSKNDLPKVICSVCGSHHVEYAVWFNAHTETVGDHFGSGNQGDDTFCCDCDLEGRDANPPLLYLDGSSPSQIKEYRRIRRNYTSTKKGN